MADPPCKAGLPVATVDTTPAGYVDLDPALAALSDAGAITARIAGGE